MGEEVTEQRRVRQISFTPADRVDDKFVVALALAFNYPCITSE